MNRIANYILAFIGLSMIYSCAEDKPTLFKSIPAGETGIRFSNQIKETEKYNVLEYEYVYNGGGVGIGDFNSDGLQDIFFTGNMSPNQLYLNKGNLKFEDVSETAGISAKDRWSSSVQIVDIDNDGRDDIHVTAMTYEDGQLRKNMLFRNKGLNVDGVPQFDEVAELYNIADSTNSTTAAFLDYDNDGDLDLFLAVNKMIKKISPNTHRTKELDGSSQIRDRLYRNDSKDGQIIFKEVSTEAGILYGGFSLGVNVADINEDGYKDIYVTNDYLTNDLMYINNGDGTFTDRASDYMKHTSYSAMGNDIADLNNDGLADIVALDMLPEDNYRRKTMLPNNNHTTYLNNERFNYQYQFIRNTLQFNQGVISGASDLLFSETAMMSGISSTDWSWAPIIADFDMDGFRDIIATNGFPKDVTDRDFIDYNSDKGSFVTREELLKKIPSVKIKNYAFRNKTTSNGGIPIFEDVTTDWGITDPTFSNGGAYVDLDNDGDLDYVVNNINDSASVFQSLVADQDLTKEKNWLKIKFEGPNTNIDGQGAIVEIKYGDNQLQKGENTPYRGYLSSMEKGLYFGLGSNEVIEELTVSWTDKTQIIKNISSNQVLTVKYTDAGPKVIAEGDFLPLFSDYSDETGIDFTHKESDYTDYNVQGLLMHKLSQFGPSLSVADVNGDGLDDLYVGGSHFNKGKFFIQNSDGKFTERDLLAGPDGDDKKEEELGTLFFDADNDGDQDLYLASGGYEFKPDDESYLDRLYLNENGTFRLSEGTLPNIKSSSSCVKGADFDNDGDIDLFIGGRVKPLEYPLPVSSYLLENDGTGHFTNVNDKIFPALNDIGMVCDALWTDYDSDGAIDLMVAGEWMPLQFYKNINGQFSEPIAVSNSEGWWNSIASADFDKDGDIDYVVGNNGKNTLLKASAENPIGLYFADFDKNESLDIFPSAYFKDKSGNEQEYPYFGLGDMQKEVIKLKRQYKRHFNFAEASMSNIVDRFHTENQVKASKLEAKTLESTYVENLGNGEFKMHALPDDAQVAPIFGMKTGDYNNDGNTDIIVIGNDYGTEVSQGRQDALNGLLFLGDGSGGFKSQSIRESGINIPGDAKSIVSINSKAHGEIHIVGQNRGPLKTLSNSQKSRNISLEKDDQIAIIKDKSGKSYVQEFYWGDSFLSQSGRRFKITNQMTSIEIIKVDGSKRQINI